jgi:uncharacterized cupredoxin-like copper-binding protein
MLSKTLRGGLAAGIVEVATSASSMAFADATTITISLWDNGADKEFVTTMGYGGNADMSMANMGIKLSQDVVKAGSITFAVANNSKETIHEMLILPLKDGAPPPVNESEAKIDEETAGDLGEVAELDPGKSGSTTLDLAPGRYLLSCNIAGHYMNGMWVVLTVE